MVDTVGSSAGAAAPLALDLRVSSTTAAAPASGGAAAPAFVGTATRPATYFNPSLRFDAGTDQIVILFRNPDTGEVLRQYPSRQVIAQYQHAQQTASDQSQVQTSGPQARVAAPVVSAAPPRPTPPPTAPSQQGLPSDSKAGGRGITA